MKKNKIWFSIFCIIVLLSTSVVYGISYKLPDPSYDFYIYDEAGIVDKDIETYIVEINKELYKKTGAQIVVATVNSLDNMDINSYATALYEKWKIGSKEYDNGMLLLIVPDNRELWIEVGYGLEGEFPDSKVKRIIDNYILPYFAEEEYSDGVLSGFNQILLGLEDEYNISLNKSKVVDYPKNEIISYFPNICMIIGIIIFLFIDFRFFRGMITYSLLRGIGKGGRSGGSSRGGGRSSGGGGRSGGGGAGGKWWNLLIYFNKLVFITGLFFLYKKYIYTKLQVFLKR